MFVSNTFFAFCYKLQCNAGIHEIALSELQLHVHHAALCTLRLVCFLFPQNAVIHMPKIQAGQYFLAVCVMYA